MSIESALRKGDVTRLTMPGRDSLPLYLGSGSSGGTFDGWGLLQDGTCAAAPGSGHTAETMRVGHADHFYHGQYGIDCWVGLYGLRFADGLPPLASDAQYRQQLRCMTAV